MKEEEIVLRNWEALKPLVLAKWNKLRRSELEGIQPVMKELIDIIHHRYADMPRLTLVQEILNLDEQILKNR